MRPIDNLSSLTPDERLTEVATSRIVELLLAELEQLRVAAAMQPA
jgi:hypothetical protein